MASLTHVLEAWHASEEWIHLWCEKTLESQGWVNGSSRHSHPAWVSTGALVRSRLLFSFLFFFSCFLLFMRVCRRRKANVRQYNKGKEGGGGNRYGGLFKSVMAIAGDFLWSSSCAVLSSQILWKPIPIQFVRQHPYFSVLWVTGKRHNVWMCWCNCYPRRSSHVLIVTIIPWTRQSLTVFLTTLLVTHCQSDPASRLIRGLYQHREK